MLVPIQLMFYTSMVQHYLVYDCVKLTTEENLHRPVLSVMVVHAGFPSDDILVIPAPPKVLV